jgi:hypothetical protein
MPAFQTRYIWSSTNHTVPEGISVNGPVVIMATMIATHHDVLQNCITNSSNSHLAFLFGSRLIYTTTHPFKVSKPKSGATIYETLVASTVPMMVPESVTPAGL